MVASGGGSSFPGMAKPSGIFLSVQERACLAFVFSPCATRREIQFFIFGFGCIRRAQLAGNKYPFSYIYRRMTSYSGGAYSLRAENCKHSCVRRGRTIISANKSEVHASPYVWRIPAPPACVFVVFCFLGWTSRAFCMASRFSLKNHREVDKSKRWRSRPFGGKL